MLDYDRQSISDRNCRRVRIMYPVQFLQVRADPACADNVQLRFGQNEWQTMHVLDAIALTRLVRRAQRKRLRAHVP